MFSSSKVTSLPFTDVPFESVFFISANSPLVAFLTISNPLAVNLKSAWLWLMIRTFLTPC